MTESASRPLVCNVVKAMRLLGVSRRTVYYWMKTGRVPYRVGEYGSRLLEIPPDLQRRHEATS